MDQEGDYKGCNPLRGGGMSVFRWLLWGAGNMVSWGSSFQMGPRIPLIANMVFYRGLWLTLTLNRLEVLCCRLGGNHEGWLPDPKHKPKP